jgi:hypothetical protein
MALWNGMTTRAYAPSMARHVGLLLDLVQSVVLAKGAEPALKVVDDGPRKEGFFAISTETRPPVDVVINWGLLVLRICEVTLLEIG